MRRALETMYSSRSWPSGGNCGLYSLTRSVAHALFQVLIQLSDFGLGTCSLGILGGERRGPFGNLGFQLFVEFRQLIPCIAQLFVPLDRRFVGGQQEIED